MSVGLVTVMFKVIPSYSHFTQALKASKARYQLSKQENLGARRFRAGEVPGMLLNMCLINLGVPHPGVRQAAYGMLVAVSKEVLRTANAQQDHTDRLLIPHNTAPFTVALSTKLASSFSPITLEFLWECLHAMSLKQISLASKLLCLEYIRPWLPNLKLFCNPSEPEKLAKAQELIKAFMEFTINEPLIAPAIHSGVWKVLGEASELMEMLVGAILPMSKEAGEICDSVLISVAWCHPDKVIRFVLDCILKGLWIDDEQWLSYSTRAMGILSFSSITTLPSLLPDLCHVLVSLFSSGTAVMRATVYGMLINVVHGLLELRVPEDDKLQALRLVIVIVVVMGVVMAMAMVMIMVGDDVINDGDNDT